MNSWISSSVFLRHVGHGFVVADLERVLTIRNMIDADQIHLFSSFGLTCANPGFEALLLVVVEFPKLAQDSEWALTKGYLLDLRHPGVVGIEFLG